MTRAKCAGCGHRRIIRLDGMCAECLYVDLQRVIRNASLAGASQGEKDKALGYLARVTEATKRATQLQLGDFTQVPPSQRQPATISEGTRDRDRATMYD